MAGFGGFAIGNEKINAPIAQLDRAPVYGTGCCWFDPSWAHQPHLSAPPMAVKKQVKFMQEALKEAKDALREDEVPIGAVVVYKNKIVGRAHDQVERLKDPTAHAEMLAITCATNALNTKWLNGVSLYVTIEPCSMCAGALVLARIKDLIYGADDPKAGGCGSVTNIINNKKLNHRIKVQKGVLEKECGYLLTQFFKGKRQKNKRLR